MRHVVMPPSHVCLSPPSQYAIPTTFSNPKFELCFFLQMLHTFVDHCSRHVLALFDLAGDLGQAAFLIDIPSEILVCWGRGIQETLGKAVKKGVQKRTLKKTRTCNFSGGPFWLPREPLGRLLRLSWDASLPSCPLFAPGKPKGRPKRIQELHNSRPKAP